MVTDIFYDTMQTTEGRGITGDPEKIERLICHSHIDPDPIDKYHPLEKIHLVIMDKWFEMDNKHLY